MFRLVLITFPLVLALTWVSSDQYQYRDPPQRIPMIARIARVQVGFDTLRILERQLGPGEPTLGGHPRGARLWRCKDIGWVIYADAFEYNARGKPVIDTLVVCATEESPWGVPTSARTSLSRKELSLVGSISLGMTKRQVLMAAKSKLPPPVVKPNTVVWTSVGFVRYSRQFEYQVNDTWTAELHFSNDHLYRMDITTP